MNREEITRLAKEADLWLTSDERIAAVERFAALRVGSSLPGSRILSKALSSVSLTLGGRKPRRPQQPSSSRPRP